MSWERSQKYEKSYDESQWNIPFSEYYWLKFMHIGYVKTPALEVGCGAHGIWKYNSHVFGLDPIQQEGENFILGKAEALPFDDRHFKDVYCINALDHTQDPSQSVFEMMRVCSERLVIWSYVFPNKNYKPLYHPHPHAFTEQQFSEITKSQDFDVFMKIRIYTYDEFSKYSPSFLSKMKLKISNALGVHAILLHLRRIR